MRTTIGPRGRQLGRTMLLVFCVSSASGCAMLPPLIEHGYTVLSGISYLATSKGPSDHFLSLLTRKDCSLFRLLRGQPVCTAPDENTNRPLLVTLREALQAQPRDLPPEELLRQLPPPISPSIPLDSTIAASD